MMSFVLALAIAGSFWSHRGYQVPCHAQPVIQSQRQINAGANLTDATRSIYTSTWPARINPGCVVFLSPLAVADERQDPPTFCAAIVHEAGNLIGIPETTGQHAAITDQRGPAVPWDCVSWRAWAHAHNW